MVVIARGFGFAIIVFDTALEEEDVKRKGDRIAVLMAVRRSMKNLDGRDRPHTADMLLEKKIHTEMKMNPRTSLVLIIPILVKIVWVALMLRLWCWCVLVSFFRRH